MAITASIIVSPTVVTESQYVAVTLVIFQPAGGGAVQLLRIDPYLLNTGASGGTPPNACPGLPGNAPIVTGGATTLTSSATANTSYAYSWVTQIGLGSVPSNPIFPSTPLYEQYTVGAVAYFSDGTTANASSSIFVYSLMKDSTLALTAMPGNGDLRHDANTESALLAAERAATAIPAVSALQSMTFFNLATTGRA